jgi:hypothetical protein
MQDAGFVGNPYYPCSAPGREPGNKLAEKCAVFTMLDILGKPGKSIAIDPADS